MEFDRYRAFIVLLLVRVIVVVWGVVSIECLVLRGFFFRYSNFIFGLFLIIKKNYKRLSVCKKILKRMRRLLVFFRV